MRAQGDMKGRLIIAAPEWLSTNGTTTHLNPNNHNHHPSSSELPPAPQQPSLLSGKRILSSQRLRLLRKQQLQQQQQSPQPQTLRVLHSQGADPPESQTHRIALALLACLQNSLVGGLVYGWASINPMLTEPEYPKGGCGITLADSTLIFSMASCTGMAATLALGFILDQWGPRVCSVVAHVAIAAGCQLFAVSHTVTGFTIATCLVAFGGPGIQVSIVHLANLFPRNQFTALALLNGTISISMSVFAIFSWLWENYLWITYRQLFGTFSIVVVLSLLASLAFMPDFSYKAPTPDEAQRHVGNSDRHTIEDDYIEAETVHQRWMVEQPLNSYLRQEHPARLARSDSFILSKKAIESGVLDMVSLKDAPFATQFVSGYYQRGNLFFAAVCFLANFYVASITIELADTNDYTIHEQDHMTRQFTLILSAGFLASFGIGIVMDHAGIETATAGTLVLGMAHELILIFGSKSQWWMNAGFVVYICFRQFLFPCSIALITSRLGYKFFGLLNGIAFLSSGIAQLFMVPVVNLVKGTCHKYNSQDPALISNSCDNGHWTELHVIELIVLALLLLVPLYDHRANVEQKERIQEVVKVRSSWRRLYYGGASPLLGRLSSRNGSQYHDNSYGSYGSLAESPVASYRGAAARDELDVLDEDASDEGLRF